MRKKVNKYVIYIILIFAFFFVYPAGAFLHEFLFGGICRGIFLDTRFYLALAFRAVLPIVASVILHFGLFAAVAGKPVRAVWRPVASLHAFAIVPWAALVMGFWLGGLWEVSKLSRELGPPLKWPYDIFAIFVYAFGLIASVALTFKPHFREAIGPRIKYLRFIIPITSFFAFAMVLALAYAPIMCT